MNRVISYLQNITVRVIATTLIVVIPFFITGMLGYGNGFQAQAKALTTQYNSAEASRYRLVQKSFWNQLKT